MFWKQYVSWGIKPYLIFLCILAALLLSAGAPLAGTIAYVTICLVFYLVTCFLNFLIDQTLKMIDGE